MYSATFRSLAISAVLAACLSAQDFRATLNGLVSDPSGAAIPSATVRAVNAATNEVREVKATTLGMYTIPYLNPGTYNVEAAASGFRTLKREGIVLQVAQKMNLSLALEVGDVAQAVTVFARQEVIDTSDASRGLVFDPIKVAQYPLNGRQTYMLMSLTPGVIFGQETFGASGFSGTRGWDVNNSYKINGSRQGGNVFLLNGAPISSDNGSWRLAPNVEAVQEFKVMTNTYDASFGDFRGGAVNTTIKSGTNTWRGNVFEFYRTRSLDANSFQSNRTGQPRLFHNQHQFGGVAGGPIRKDKDFIFGSFEGWQELVPFPINVTTPPMALRDGQHFSDYGMTIFDPLTTHNCTSGSTGNEPCSGNRGSTYWRDPFPGNVLPRNRISPVGAKILGYYPKETVAGQLVQNYVSNNTGRYYYNQPMFRFDHIFGDNDKFYAMYSFQDGYEYRSNFPKPAASPGNVDNKRTFSNVIANYTKLLSATTIFDVRSSYYRFVQKSPGYNDEALKFSASKDFGMTNMVRPPTSPGDIVPGFTVGGYGQIFGNGSPLGTWRPETTWNLAPSVNMSRAAHNLRFGFDYKYRIIADGATGNSQGNFTFESGLTRQASGRSLTSTDQFNGIATALLGIPTSGSIAYNDTFYRTRPSYGFYVQDDWKLTPRLTVNMGLRYDISLPYLERFNRRTSTFDPAAVNPLSDQILARWRTEKVAWDSNPANKYPYPDPPKALTGRWLFAGVDGQPRRVADTDFTNLAPRLGVAWRLGAKTVLRTGAGVFYENLDLDQDTVGFSESTSFTGSLDGGKTPSACANGGCAAGPPSGAYSLVNPFPQGYGAPGGSSLGAMAGVGKGVGFTPRHYKIPRTYQYSFGLQRELPQAIVVEVSFSGNRQIYGTNSFDMNWPEGAAGLALQNQAVQDTAFYSTSMPNPFYGILPQTSNRGASPTISRSSLMQLYPLWNSMSNDGMQSSGYRAEQLQTRVEKRAFGDQASARGVMTWIFSWTFGKEYEKNHRLGSSWDTTKPLYYEISNQDKAHSLSFSGVWDLPFGKKRRFGSSAGPALNHAIGGWKMDWILSYVSGYPLGWPNLINYCGDWHAKEQTENSWFNNDKSCYSQQPSNTLRYLPDRFPGTIREHQAPQLNAAVSKDVRFGERFRLNLKGEGFNVTNTPIRTNPNTDINSPDFGKLGFSQRNFPRFFQLAAKFYF